MLQLAIETAILCLGFFLAILAFTIKDRRGGLHWYPEHVQQAAIERGMATASEIDKRSKNSKWIIMAISALIVIGSVFVINGTHEWHTAFLQITFMVLVLNLMDAIFVDYVWVTKTKYWMIEGLEDIRDIGKPSAQILTERIKSSIALVIVAAILACITFLL